MIVANKYDITNVYLYILRCNIIQREAPTTEEIQIYHEHPHYTTEEVFTYRTKQTWGFTEKNYNKGLHSQEFYEVNIVLCGEATHYIGKNKIRVAAGDSFVIPPNVMHGYVGGEGFDVYHLLIHPKYLELYSSRLQLIPSFSVLFKIDPLMREKRMEKLHFRLSEEQLADILPCLMRIRENSRRTDIEGHIMADGESLTLIAHLCSVHEKFMGSLEGEAADDRDFLSSISYIYSHYDEKITTDMLARIARMSRNSYISAFKRSTGKTPAKFLMSHRVEMAEQMLKNTGLSVAEIAHKVGCNDTSHLIKVFSSQTGMTPAAFRQTSR